MSSSLHSCITRISITVFFLIAVLAPVARAMSVDDLDPAQHWKLGALAFSGNRLFADRDLQAVMRTKPRPFYMPWKARPEFEPTTFTNDLKRLRIFYEAHGYYHLRLSYDLKTEVKGKERIVDVELHLVEGEPIRIASIDVTIDGYHPPENTSPITKLP